MGYTITQYTYDAAKKLGVEVRVSLHPGKKIDVYKDGKFLCAIGDAAYSDYPTYIESHGKTYADVRRRLFRLRHAKNIYLRGSPAWYTSKLLW